MTRCASRLQPHAREAATLGNPCAMEAATPCERKQVSHVVIMGGLIEAADGALTLDRGATNNTYDLASAEKVYGSLIKDDGQPRRYVAVTLPLRCRYVAVTLRRSAAP